MNNMSISAPKIATRLQPGEPTRKVLKWLVPVDDYDHPVGSGPVVLVAMQNGVVTVWTDEHDSLNVKIGSARVYGTGQRVPIDVTWLGSCMDTYFVWHVFSSTKSNSLRAVRT